MPLIYAYGQALGAVLSPTTREWIYGLPGTAIDTHARLPLPRPCIVAECACAWNGAIGAGSATAHVLRNGVPEATFTLSGPSGFLTALPSVGAAQGAGISFDLTYDGTYTPTNFQVSTLLRPIGPPATKARLYGSFSAGTVLLKAPPFGFDHFQIVDTDWAFAPVGGVPMNTGLLIPAPATLTRLIARNASNILDVGPSLHLWDELAAASFASVAWDPFQSNTTKDSGALSIPIAAGKVLTYRGQVIAASAGQMDSPLKATALLEFA